MRLVRRPRQFPAAVIFASVAFCFSGARTLSRPDGLHPEALDLPGPDLLGTKVLAVTALPAGFVAMARVGLVRNPIPQDAALAVGGAAGYVALALAVFQLGLRRYRRGASPGG